jgi:hypothetical protein
MYTPLTDWRAALRRLPALHPAPEGWSRILERLEAPPQAVGAISWPRQWQRTALAAAALATVVVTSALWFAARPAGEVAVLRARAHGPTAEIGQLVSESQQLESILQDLPARPALELAATSANIDALQSRIQELDLQLVSAISPAADGVQARQLWSERVRLLNSLVGVRYAEALRGGHQPVPVPNRGEI